MDITIEGILLGLLAIAIGLAFAFYGFRLFLVLLPIWGFFAGFLLGANGIDYTLRRRLPGHRDRLGRGLPAGTALRGPLLPLLLGRRHPAGRRAGLPADHRHPAVDQRSTSTASIAFILALIVGAIFAVGFFLLHMPAVLVIVATAIVGRRRDRRRCHHRPRAGAIRGPRASASAASTRPHDLGCHLAHRGHRPGLRGGHLPDPHGGRPLRPPSPRTST